MPKIKPNLASGHQQIPGFAENERKGLGGLRVEHFGAVPNADYHEKEPAPKPESKFKREPIKKGVRAPKNKNAEVLVDKDVEKAIKKDLQKRNLKP